MIGLLPSCCALKELKMLSDAWAIRNKRSVRRLSEEGWSVTARRVSHSGARNSMLMSRLCDSSVIPNHNSASCVSDQRKGAFVKLYGVQPVGHDQKSCRLKTKVNANNKMPISCWDTSLGVVLHCPLIFNVKCGIWSTRFNNHWSKVKPLLKNIQKARF